MSRLTGRAVSRGRVVAEAVVSTQPFGFWQGMDPLTGVVIDRRHDTFGQSLAGKVFIFPYGRGSTGTPGVFLEAVRNGCAPAALVNVVSEPIVAICAILADEFLGVEIPVVDAISAEELARIRTGDRVAVDGSAGTLTLEG